MGADVNSGSTLHSRAGNPVLPLREPLLDRVVLVRKPLLICVAFLTEKRGILLLVLKNSTRREERTIACSVHRLHHGFAIYYCDVEPITWENQEIDKHFTDVELASPFH